jgi:predicted KAP-like P-loop ATPase
MDVTTLSFDERDEFQRKNIAEKVNSLLQADIDISPMVIDGSWGTGKTEFCHKLINLMHGNDTHHLIYIDAFKADHADEPLMTVLAEVIKVLPDDEIKQGFMKKALPAVRYSFKTIAKAGVSHLLRQDVADVVDDFDKQIQGAADKAIDATVESVLKDHVKADQNLKALQTALTEITSVKPIILFVDELDRCRPNFAVDMLEIIKHTFDVEGVSFVLITNTQQLKASVNHCYGNAVDAQRYLDKFVKFTVALPETVDTNGHREKIAALEHYKNLVRSNPLLAELKLFECGTIRMVNILITENNLSLREVETIVRHIEIYVTLTQQGHLSTNTIFGYKVLTLLAVAVYSISPSVANSILAKKLDANQFAQLMGVEKLSSCQVNRPEEVELICHLINREAYINKEAYLPPDDELATWQESIRGYFQGSFMSGEDRFTSIFASAIQAIRMC